MATSSSSAQDHPQTAPGSPPQQPPSSTASRRLPPPCWSHDETVALIDGYRDKWYSLRRGNLRAPHWQEVADAVAGKCPINPPKTSVQCRHKMEKLRKRYRAELQRAYATPSGRYCSSWVHFKRMDSMEKGSSTSSAVPVNTGPVDRDEDEEFEDDQVDPDQDLYPRSVKHEVPYNTRSFYGSLRNGIGGGSGNGSAGGSGFRIRLPRRSSIEPPEEKICKKFDENLGYSPNPYPNFGSSKVLRDGYMGRFGMGKRGGDEGVGKRKEGDPAVEMVSAIKALGDGFVRMERMKMEVAREVEAMRMEMEMKRTEMILQSQERIVEAFAKAFSYKKNKKAKRMPTPEA
ncbi:unnamed protein product [Ilex paraguariensis]|uniref:MADF domain-containing protein n=1 Tax=Ilex paraguariensis TaxID=185542 RepID=A0ABC8QT37_9AQUA